MNQPVKVLVIQPAPGNRWLVQTVGGPAPHFSQVYSTTADVIRVVPDLIHLLDKPLPPQPETPPKEP